MTKTAIKEAELLERVKDFTVSHIAPRRRELITALNFPDDLWQTFARSGLAALTAPAEFGGADASYHCLSKAGNILNRHGGVPGATMVFMSHWLFIKLHILDGAPTDMQQLLLPKLVDGSATLSVAISEPGAGAHPKHLKTTARHDGDTYILNGEKAFLTNGPLADYFIVLAVTAEKENRKAFSAILVPASASGFQRTDGIKIDFLHPCPHGGIRLDNCRVPTTNLIGAEGDAFERTSLRMRAIEDAIGAAGQVGSLSCLLADIASILPPEKASAIGAIATCLQALTIIAEGLAAMADMQHQDVNVLLERQLGFRQMTKSCFEDMEILLQNLPEPLAQETSVLARDISKFQAIATQAHMARLAKVGRARQMNPDLF